MKKKHVALSICLSIPLAAGLAGAAIALSRINKKDDGGGEIIDTRDLAQVKDLSSRLQGMNAKTMTDVVNILEEQEIDLEGLVAHSNNQFVWDEKQNVILSITESGKIAAAPDGYDKSKFKESQIWKMVKLAPINKLNGTEPNYDYFDKNSKYAQYIRRGQEIEETIEFSTSLDTGKNTNYTLKYVKPTVEIETTPTICTNNADLEINGSIEDINHYGHAKSLTVTKLADDGVYNEYGTVDGNVILKGSGSFVAQPTSEINTIIIDSKNVTVEVKGDEEQAANVGSIARSENVTPEEAASNIKVDGTIPEEQKPEIQTQDPVPVPEPEEETRYAGGIGTLKSPYIITKKQHLINCRDDVNGLVTNDREPMYFKLLNDIDLEDMEWEPIGKNYDHRFVGVFDGNGYTIKNFKPVNEFETKTKREDRMYLGLFGITDGAKNEYFTCNDDVWDSENDKLIEAPIVESNYQTVIKNLTLENVQVDGSNKGTKCVGGLAGTVTNTYIENVQIKSGYVKGDKGVGGLVGSLDGSVCSQCSIGELTATNSKFEVSATKYNVGGITGTPSYDTPSSCEAIIGCNVFGNVEISVTDSEAGKSHGGYMGGIVGMGQNSKAMVIDGCNNFGTIKADGAVLTSFAGISGQTGSVHAIANCINAGQIISENSGGANEYVAGIACGGTSTYINCKNTGTINASAKINLAGITAGYSSQTPGHIFKLVQCTNEGTLTNKYDDTKKSELCADMQQIILKDLTFKDVDELNASISGVISLAISIEMKDCVVEDTTGTLNIPGQVTSVISNTHICDSVNIKNGQKNLYLKIPGLNMVIDEVTECNLTNGGDNSSITINAGAKLNSASVYGENSYIINNGTVAGSICIDGKAVTGENNGSCARVSFGSGGTFGTGTKHFTNKGTILNVAAGANSHVLCCVGGSSCEISIENYGRIEYQRNGQTTPGYLTCLYTSNWVHINNYENSVIKTDTPYWFALGNSLGMNLRYKDGAKIYLNDTEKTFESFAWSKLHVEKIQ